MGGCCIPLFGLGFGFFFSHPCFSDKDIDIDAGGLRDRQLTVSSQQRNMVAPAIEAAIETVKSSLFPVHGL